MTDEEFGYTEDHEESSYPCLDAVMDEIDSMVYDVIKQPNQHHETELMNIVDVICEEYRGTFDRDTIVGFVNSSYDIQKRRYG